MSFIWACAFFIVALVVYHVFIVRYIKRKFIELEADLRLLDHLRNVFASGKFTVYGERSDDTD